jgi:DUF1009 family protein
MNETKLNKKIGIIAGNGSLPKQLALSLLDKNIKPYTVALTQIADEEVTEVGEYIWSKVTTVGKIFEFFNQNEIKQIVLVGGMKRPSFASLIPDRTGFKLLNRLRKLNNAGDNSMFNEIIKFIEENGFHLLGVDEVLPELLASKGPLAEIKPNKKQLADIEYGYKIAQEIGRLDIGQAAVVQNSATIGVEASEGTDGLIKRCANLQFDGKGAILIKTKKPNQDRRIDLPSIGIKTIETLSQLGYAGVAVEAGSSLIIDKETTLDAATKLGVFVFGV